MALLPLLRRWLPGGLGGERRSSASAHPRDPAVAGWWGAGSATASGVSVTPALALRCAAVYACVGLLADAVASLPFNLYRRGAGGAREHVRGHPLDRLLDEEPNPWQSAIEFRQELMVHLLLWGNAYAEVIQDARGRAAELRPLHPDRTAPRRLSTGAVVYDHWPDAGPRRTLLAAEVMHLKRRPFTADGLAGDSPTGLHRETIGLALAAQDYAARFFGNAAVPRGVIKVPQVLQGEAKTLLRQSVEQAHRGANVHRVAILDGGMEWAQIGMTNEDAQFRDLRRDQIGEICRIFGVPSHLVNDTERSTSWGSGIEQQSIGFLVYAVRPLLKLWRLAAQLRLLGADERAEMFCDFLVEDLLRGDFKSRMDGYAVGRQWGFLSINDVRRLENLPPIAGGDDHHVPVNMAPHDRVLDVLLKTPPAPARALNGAGHHRQGANGHDERPDAA